jgi:hypothetical protein
MANYLIPITGRLVDPLGSGISGASLFFYSKATTRGTENVAKTADARYLSDPSGFYSFGLATGWYKIDYQEAGWLESQRLGVATVTGNVALDLGTLIANSIPPPSHLEDISDVSTLGRLDGSPLLWNQAQRKWVATGSFVPTGNQRVISTAITAGTSGVWVSYGANFPSAPKVQLTASFTGENQWIPFVRYNSVSGCSGFFGGIVTDNNGVLYTTASL